MNLKKLLGTVSGAALLMGVAHASARADITGPDKASNVSSGGAYSTQTDFLYINTETGSLGLASAGSLNSSPISGSVTKSKVAGSPQAIKVAANTGIAISGASVSTTTTVTSASTLTVTSIGSGAGTANGILVNSTGSIMAIVNNSGLIDVDASFSGSPTQTAFANGVIATNTAGGGSPAFVSFNNSGNVDVDSFARETCCSTAIANANALGVGLGANGTSGAASVTATLDNLMGGSINVNATAVAITIGAIALANANATGVTMSASGGQSINVALANNGNMNVGALASVLTVSAGTINTAKASALGINQVAVGTTATGSINVSLTNSSTGTISVSATANAVGNVANATARVQGINQTATGGSSVSASLTNNNTISVSGKAKAVATSSAKALAGATTTILDQFANGASAASVSFANTGTFSGVFSATATDFAGNATAKASLSDDFIDQFANITGTGPGKATAVLTNTNSGTILLDMNANANASTLAKASAIADKFIDQFANVSGAAATGTATVLLSNTASMSALLNATATATLGKASALASFSNTAIDQFANAVGAPGSKATVQLNNTGSILLDLNALSFGITQAKATATFSDTVIDQFANVDGVGTASIVNGGSIQISADARAAASAGIATAQANFDDSGIDQFANGSTGAAGTVLASLSNTATITISANATATGLNGAKATAYFDNAGINQFANGQASGKTLLTNSGNINIALDANANATSGTATALAKINQTGIDQFANASVGAGGLAEATMINSSSIVVDMDAKAVAGGIANATAVVQQTVIDQFVNGVTAAALFSNTGTISALFNATATGNTANALANLNQTGIGQFAVASDGAGGSASLTLNNTGNILFDLNANASAVSSAKATATIGQDLVTQFAIGTTASAVFNNTGSFSALLNATATDSVGNATALAKMGQDGIRQFVLATVGAGGTAAANFTNTGSLLIDLNASANASTAAKATAFIDDNPFEQNSNGVNVTNTFFNDGTLQVLLEADASATAGIATAVARIDNDFVNQIADASVGAGGTATNSILNSGTMTFAVMADATGRDGAKASAIFDDEGLYQPGNGVNRNDIITNNGTFLALAQAKAVASSTGSAAAKATFDSEAVQQFGDASFSGGGTGSSTFTNSNSFTVSLVATATGVTAAKATAEYDSDVMDQSARGINAKTLFVNSGTMIAAADAFASATGGTAFAKAIFENAGLEQNANATIGSTGAASAAFSNTNAILFDLDAKAVAQSSAKASVTVEEEVIQQRATGPAASAVFTNTGTISALFTATATDTAGNATALAFISRTAIDQDAIATIGGGGKAANTFTNSGTLLVDLEANAFASTLAKATVGATFQDDIIHQLAQGSSAANVLSNTGTVTAIFDAFASASAGAATAKARLGKSGAFVQQQAWGSSGAGSVANNTFTNSGDMTFILMAEAKATGSAIASAINSATVGSLAGFSFDSGGFIYQTGVGENVSHTLTNSGNLSTFLSAKATSTMGKAVALASMGSNAAGLIIENAFATGTGSTDGVTVNITNSGVMTFSADALAVGKTMATGTARLREGFEGKLRGLNITYDWVNTTSGTVNFLIDAFASAASGTAKAVADMDSTPFQITAANTTGGGQAANGKITMTNDGTLNVILTAKAVGNNATATATNDTEIWDNNAGGTNTATMTNTNTGTFRYLVQATASAATGAAKAHAEHSSEIWDSVAERTFGGGPALAGSKSITTIDNSGTVDIDIIANAFGKTAATAEASMGSEVFDNDAADNETNILTILNSGSFSFVLDAFASATSGVAKATAEFRSTPIDLDVGRFTSAPGVKTSTVTMTNSGDMAFVAMASAQGTAGATAIADLDEGFAEILAHSNQGVGKETVSATFSNTSAATFTGLIWAKATATAGPAKASATNNNDNLFELRAGDTGTPASPGSVAKALFNNSGTFSVGLMAMATGPTANAKASNTSSGLVVKGFTSFDASATVINSGDLTIFADAHAVALSGPAVAFANLGDDIIDIKGTASTTATGTTAGGTGLGVFTNSNTGTLNILAMATASGDTRATATAQVVDNVFDLDGMGTNSGTMNFTNNGTLLAMLDAVAKATGGPALAQAIFQSTALNIDAGVTTVNVNTGLDATINFNNTGSLTFAAMASASATNTAVAKAIFSSPAVDFFLGNAAGSFNNTINMTNSGNLLILADAFATAATGKATALASASSDLLDINIGTMVTLAGDSGTFNFTNTSSGTFSILLNAKAVGTSMAKATAEAGSSGFDVNVAGDTATVNFTNNGIMTLGVNASATALAGVASAKAEFESAIIDLDAASNGPTNPINAEVNINNTGTLNIFAKAAATGTAGAKATASVGGTEVFDPDAEGSKTAVVSITNSGAMNFTMQASALASVTGAAFAFAEFGSEEFQVSVSNGGTPGTASSTATINFTNTNTGTINALAFAKATGVTGATALAQHDSEILELDADDNAKATINVTNAGSYVVNVTALAKATSAGTAKATANQNNAQLNRIHAGDAGATTGTVNFNNSGTFSIFFNATATGVDGAFAKASATSEVFDVDADGTTAVINFTNTNSGTLNVIFSANASVQSAFAIATASFGSDLIEADAGTSGSPGTTAATANITNNGTMNFGVLASALGDTAATAKAVFSEEHIQADADGAKDVTSTITNSGTINSLAIATASASGGSAKASAIYDDAAINNDVDADTSDAVGLTATGTFNNTGTVNLSAIANATATAGAAAIASLTGGAITTTTITFTAPFCLTPTCFLTFTNAHNGLIEQNARHGKTLSLNVTNSGTFNANFVANAVGSTAFAHADFTGVEQNVKPEIGSTGTMNFTNAANGTFNLTASAFASGTATNATASATVIGVLQHNTTAVPPFITPTATSGNTAKGFTANFTNSGTFNVNAKATATGASTTNAASAFAVGYSVEQAFANNTPTVNAQNSGTFNVAAVANATSANARAIGMRVTGASMTGTIISNSGTMNITASAPGGTASATGIIVGAQKFNGTVVNTGTINVLAIGSTTAIGVLFTNTNVGTGTNTIFGTSLDLGTFLNDSGTIDARVISSGTLDHGIAISPLSALHPILIDLQGNNGQGQIFGDIQMSADDRILVRNGMTYFDGDINTMGFGTTKGDMTITSNGTFTLAANTVLGGASVYIEDFTVGNSGTLAFQIHAADTTIGQVNADTANLGGTVYVVPTAGLYPNMRTYEEVVVANTLNGAFSMAGVKPNSPINSGSPLLNIQAVNQPDDTVDLTFTRAAFNVPGLTINQMSAGSGIENVYSTTLGGAFGAMVSEMFTFDAPTYTNALNQLHGSEHAQNMQSLLWAPNMLNYAITDRINIGPYQSRGRTGDIIQRGDTAIWGKIQKNWGQHDGDVEAPGYDQDQFGVYIGADHAFATNFVAGFAVGYYENELMFNNSNRKEDEGVQLGLYGVWDNQDYYVRGIFGYGSYDADSRRSISIGTTANGTARGQYDARTISLYGELGKRIAIPNFGNQAFFTPYGGFSYADVKQDPFTETGVPAANLAFFENSIDSFMVDLGARFSASFEAGANSLVIPELSFAWQHNFSDEIVSLNTSFAGAPSGANFSVISSFTDQDSLLVHAGVGIVTGDALEVKLEYGGRFNSQYEDHSASLRFTLMFGR